MKDALHTFRFTQKIMAFCCCVFLSSISHAASAQALDQIVAVVNDDVITRSELNHAIDMTKAQLTQQNTALPSDADLEKQVLNQLTDKKLQLQIAKQAGVKVTDDDLNSAIQRIADQNHMSLSQLYDQVTMQGLNTNEYRHEIREQMTLRKIEQQEVVNQITVSPQEVDRFMHSQAWLIKGSDRQYHLQDILVPIPDAPKPSDLAAAKARAQSIIDRIHKGESFQSIAAQSSASGPNALQGGDLGWRKLPEIPSVFAKPVATMKLHDVAGPIQAENGYHVIELSELRDSTPQEKPSRKEIESMLFERKFNEAVKTWLSKLRGSSFISMNLSGKNQIINA